MSPPDKKQRVKRALVIFVLAVVIGPPLGTVSLVSLLYLFPLAGSGGSFIELLVQFPTIVVMGAIAGYMFGLVPAFLAGVSAAYFALRDGELTWRRLAACAVFGGFIGSAIVEYSFDGRLLFAMAIPVTLYSVFIAWVLWFFFRRYLQDEPRGQKSAN